jgi:hypothetical protein
MLNTWMENENQRHVLVSVLSVQAKARSIDGDLSKGDDNVKPFIASTGRYSRFLKRYNFHNIEMTGEAAFADMVVVIHYIG